MPNRTGTQPDEYGGVSRKHDARHDRRSYRFCGADGFSGCAVSCSWGHLFCRPASTGVGIPIGGPWHRCHRHEHRQCHPPDEKKRAALASDYGYRHRRHCRRRLPFSVILCSGGRSANQHTCGNLESGLIHQLLLLAKVFGGLSLLAFGGGNAIIPDMQRIVVDQYHWMPAREFLDLFAITRATPGPGSTIVLLIGQKIAGLQGAFVGGLAMYAPSSLLVFAGARVWHHTQDSKIVAILERALGPIA